MLQVGTIAPDFELTDLDGESVSLSEMSGAPVVLNFFHTACTWSRTMLPELDAVYDRKDDIDIPILGIACGDDTVETVREFARENDINIFLGVDSDRSIREDYAITRVPTVVFIDAEGRILSTYEGASEQLPGIVEQALLATARGDELPDFKLIGNGCAP